MTPAGGGHRRGGRGDQGPGPSRSPDTTRDAGTRSSRARGAGTRGASPGGSAQVGRAGRGRTGAGRGRGGGTASGRTGGPRTGADAQGLGGEQVEGRQAVRELLRANRRTVRSLFMADGMDDAPILDEIESLAAARRVRVDHVSRRRIDSLARTDAAQGVVALARPVGDVPLESLSEPNQRGRVPFLLVLDGITDPHNLGALLRSAECAGVTGVVLPRHRAAHLSPTVAKVAAGAIEYLPMALVPGVPAALHRLSGTGIWTVGLVGESPHTLYELPVADQPVALVLGSEGAGLAPLTRRRCDTLASIPQRGELSSLNVSTAGAIACFEVARRRSV